MESALPITISSLLAAVTVLYLRGWVRLRATLPHLVSSAQLATFLAGVLLMWVAVASPLAHLDHQLLFVHMIQHLLLMALAAPLILLGAPAPVLLHSLPNSLFRGVPSRFVQRNSIRSFGKLLSHPAFCWLAGTLTVIGWHIPVLFDLGLHSTLWHELGHASFFLAGLFFWWPVVRPWPSTSREPQWSVPLYLFLATLPCDALSAYLVFCDHLVYRHYALSGRLLGLSALQDQQWAGALMWISVTLIYAVPAVAVTTQLLSTRSHRSKQLPVNNKGPRVAY